MATYMFHFTKDGEYVDGVPVTQSEGGDYAFLLNLQALYTGCHSWVKIESNHRPWRYKPAAALGNGSWETQNAKYVPECVQTAEFVRDKS